MKPFLLLIFLFLTTSLYSQDLKVVKPLYHKGAIATAECVTDSYGRYCAAIEIVFPVDNYDIESDMIVSVEKLNGRKRCFVVVPSKEKSLTIYTDGFLPLEIPFSSSTVQGGEVYQVVITKGDKSSQSAAVTTSTFTTDNSKSDFDKGIAYFKQGDYQMAVEYLMRSADKGNSNALLNLGYCYHLGKGVTQNDDEALKYFRMSAAKGNRNGQCSVGACYYYGWGTAVDYTIAAQWYRKSADQGYDVAQYRLGDCYYNGVGVKKDLSNAKYWLQQAAAKGNTNAKDLLNKCSF